VLFIMAVIGGRVIPMFTSSGIPEAQATRQPLVEKFALVGVLVLLGVDLLPVPRLLVAVIALVVAFVHAARLCLWQPWRTRGVPLVWVLHAAYGWIVVYPVLRGLAEIGLAGQLFAIRALTVGAIGGMTIGMMTRAARGHTGRPLVADGFELVCFVLIVLAAAVGVLGGMLLPSA
jgi:uncharacterized protein involved in response to NO